jgi:hypothetical protein
MNKFVTHTYEIYSFKFYSTFVPFVSGPSFCKPLSSPNGQKIKEMALSIATLTIHVESVK